ncbi:MAG TPA: amidohydrolase family protein, partial [Nitriliruptorales bacterium]|nr:amidohydrolase family protein [Nitriliruptorales bacterium]
MAPDDVLIRGAKLFDGHGFHTPGCLLVRQGRVAALAERLTPPAGVPVVEARGDTVLPGLIDAHVHVSPGDLQVALRAGVTTEVDMFGDPALTGSLRHQASSDHGLADLRSAGTGATAPGGHPTRLVERGLLAPFPTVAGPGAAEGFVATRVAEGSSFLKVVLEDGTTSGHPCPTLTAGTVRALVDAAHARDLLVVAHVLTQAHALVAVGAGVDGLAHLFLDEPPAPRFLDAVAQRDVFVIPTLTSLAARAGRDRGRALAADRHLGPLLDPRRRAVLEMGFPAASGGRTWVTRCRPSACCTGQDPPARPVQRVDGRHRVAQVGAGARRGREVHLQDGTPARVQQRTQVGIGGQGASSVGACAGSERGERGDDEHVAVRDGVEEP